LKEDKIYLKFKMDYFIECYRKWLYHHVNLEIINKYKIYEN